MTFFSGNIGNVYVYPPYKHNSKSKKGNYKNDNCTYKDTYRDLFNGKK